MARSDSLMSHSGSFAELCSIHRGYFYHQGRAGCRAEEGELCRGCHHIKKYILKKLTIICNILQLNVQGVSHMGEDYIHQGGSSGPFTAHPDYPTRIIRPSSFSPPPPTPEFLKCHSGEKSSAQSPGASLSTGGLSSQIFLRTYPFPPQQGTFLWASVPLSLTQIGNVTHLRETREEQSSRARSHASSGETSSTTGSACRF